MTCLPVLPSVLESRFILYMNDLIFVCSYIAFVAGARKYLMGARKNWAREGEGAPAREPHDNLFPRFQLPGGRYVICQNSVDMCYILGLSLSVIKI